MSNLQNLKPGDTVIVSSRYNTTITTVKRITPTGRIVVANGMGEMTFKRSGYLVGKTERSTTTLSAWTLEYEARINNAKERHELVQRVERIATSALTVNQLRRIVAILDETR
jgi:hypothetical protein